MDFVAKTLQLLTTAAHQRSRVFESWLTQVKVVADSSSLSACHGKRLGVVRLIDLEHCSKGATPDIQK